MTVKQVTRGVYQIPLGLVNAYLPAGGRIAVDAEELTPRLYSTREVFIVVPMNAAMERLKPAAVPGPQATRTCPDCLSETPKAARRFAYCTSEVTPVSV